MNENTIFLMVAVATLIEAIVESLKPVWDKTKGWNVDALMSLGISVAVCGLGGLDIFARIGFPLIVPVVGSVLTGIIASRGTNVVHELIKLLMNFRNKVESPVEGLKAGKFTVK